MQIIPAAQLLSESGFTAPILNALIPNQDNYRTLLLQPQGDIEYDSRGVRHIDRNRATSQFAAFIADALTLKADLVVTPEYSMPWQVLETTIATDALPPAGALWVIGCESITFRELQATSDRLSNKATFIFESLDPATGRFLDPVAYLFVTTQAGRGTTPRLVVLVQFKTFPMGDTSHFETNALQTGTRLY